MKIMNAKRAEVFLPVRYTIDPVSKDDLPIWVANFALS